MRKSIRYAIVLSAGILVWILFWVAYGHKLSFDVEAGAPGNMVYWYTEEFSFQGKIIVTTFMSVFAAGFVWVFLPKK